MRKEEKSKRSKKDHLNSLENGKWFDNSSNPWKYRVPRNGVKETPEEIRDGGSGRRGWN